MSYEQITYETDGPVATLTLNRPEKLNAWTYTMRREMVDAITLANEDPAIGAVIVTGAGRGFCAGADIGATFNAQIKGENVRSKDVAGGIDWVAFVRESKPLIAAVNGAAVGVGLSQILSFDVIVAARSAKMAAPFVRVGVVPELASSHFLIQRMGFGRASEFALTARFMEGEEAAATGLVDRVVDDAALMETARGIAAAISANPDRQLRWAKQLFSQNGSETDLKLVQKREQELLAEAYKSPEHKEAVDAFLNKRKPVFR
ncbi:MAG: enoyl-CoA hydratase/isomerase family protein [Minwuia sp.]|uniref:enoyl-CoA hydratase/isomerase family protein n=1 Tax=Minwuia sp. TaxID=2493630 RepID=UPI003A8952EA